MFNFAYPHLLYLLILIPVVYLLFYWAQISRKHKIKKYGQPEVLNSLMPERSPYKPYIKITLQLIALLALIIAIARPRSGEKEDVENGKGIEVMIAFDVSRSMLASSNDDPNGISRIDRAKHILDKLVNKLNNNKVGLIVFAGEAYTQLPITTDNVSAKMYINSLSTDMIQRQGTAIGEAIGLAINGFTADETVSKSIILITDAEDHEGNIEDITKEAKDRGIQVNVIGVGSPKGNPIPLNRAGLYLKDNSGQVVTTALNEQIASQIAKECDGVYVNGAQSSALSTIEDSLDRLEKGDIQHIVYKASAEQFPVFASIALIFLLIDMFILDRAIRWLNNYNFFTKK